MCPWQIHRRSQEFVLGVGWGKGYGEGCPPPQPTTGSGERRKLPQRGPGWSTCRKTSFGVFRAWKTPDSHKSNIWHFCSIYLVTFTVTITKHKTLTYIFVPFAQLKRLCKFFSTPFGYTYGQMFTHWSPQSLIAGSFSWRKLQCLMLNACLHSVY